YERIPSRKLPTARDSCASCTVQLEDRQRHDYVGADQCRRNFRFQSSRSGAYSRAHRSHFPRESRLMTNPLSPAQRRCASSPRQVNAWVAVGQPWETVERTSRARQPNVTRRHSDGSEWAETAAVRKSENGERTRS